MPRILGRRVEGSVLDSEEGEVSSIQGGCDLPSTSPVSPLSLHTYRLCSRHICLRTHPWPHLGAPGWRLGGVSLPLLKRLISKWLSLSLPSNNCSDGIFSSQLFFPACIKLCVLFSDFPSLISAEFSYNSQHCLMYDMCFANLLCLFSVFPLEDKLHGGRGFCLFVFVWACFLFFSFSFCHFSSLCYISWQE